MLFNIFKDIEILFYSSFNYLIAKGYTQMITEMLFKKNGDRYPSLKIELKNADLNKGITFYYRPLIDGEKINEIGLINFRLNSERDGFDLSDYWTWKSIESQKLNSLSKIDGARLEDKIRTYFIKVENTFRNKEIEEVLFSSLWIDVPFNWGPYK